MIAKFYIEKELERLKRIYDKAKLKVLDECNAQKGAAISYMCTHHSIVGNKYE